MTLAGVAANTKVVTAVALGLLVDEGMIDSDAPVIRIDQVKMAAVSDEQPFWNRFIVRFPSSCSA